MVSKPPRMHRLFAAAILVLSACFQTESVPGTLLRESRVQYRLDTSSSCWMQENVSLQVPKSTRFDSLRLCVHSDAGEACNTFLGAYVKYESDTLRLDFLLDSPPYTVASTAYSHGKAFAETLALEDGRLRRFIPVPESLTFHVGDKALHYAYSTRDGKYVSRDFESSGILLVSDRSALTFHGFGLDSVVLGGRVPPVPLFAGLGPMPGIVPKEVLDLGSGNRVIRVAKGEPFFLRFWRSDQRTGCGSVEVPQYGSSDTLQVAWNEGLIQIPAQSGQPIEWCGPDSCRRL